MESNNVAEQAQTEKAQTPESRLAQIEAERKELKETVAKNKVANKENQKTERANRDQVLKATSDVLKNIVKEIFGYNKLGKQAKSTHNILGNIEQLCQASNTHTTSKGVDSNDE